jgi:hypothetical protein
MAFFGEQRIPFGACVGRLIEGAIPRARTALARFRVAGGASILYRKSRRAPNIVTRVADGLRFAESKESDLKCHNDPSLRGGPPMSE